MKDTDVKPTLREGLASILGVGFDAGNEVTVLRNGCQIFPAMLEAVAEARETVELLTFVYWRGEIARRFADALSNKAKEGARVRVLLDAFGAHEMSRELVEEMRSCGVEVRWFRPLSMWQVKRSVRRTHRKVLVCDGRVGFTGGVGIAAEWEGDAGNPDEWRETHVRVKGPAACGLRTSFLSNWLEAGGGLEGTDLCCAAPSVSDGSAVQVISKPGVWGWSDVMSAFMVSLKLARTRVRITTPYFVPGEIMTRELVSARARGVTVEILMPGEHTDQRIVQHAGEARYRELLDAGVVLWRFEPTMLHAKCLTLDDEIACIGSANFNQRSMQRDEEVFLNIADARVVAELDVHFEEDVARSERYTLEQWKRRGLWQRFKERSASLFRSEM